MSECAVLMGAPEWIGFLTDPDYFSKMGNGEVDKYWKEPSEYTDAGPIKKGLSLNLKHSNSPLCFLREGNIIFRWNTIPAGHHLPIFAFRMANLSKQTLKYGTRVRHCLF